MKIILHKKILLIIAVAAFSMTLASCSKWDDFKKYSTDGEILYTGKLDSIKVYSGEERVMIKGKLKADPKISKIVIYWNSMKDSVVYPINMAKDREFETSFSVPEGIQSFVIYTYDSDGNKSVPVNAVGRAYGPRYAASLKNRVVNSAIDLEGTLDISWLTMDLSGGALVTEVRYLSTSGEKIVEVPVTADRSVFNDFVSTAPTFSYRTLFMPQTTSIDTFYTEFTNVNIFKDVTNEYMVNTRNPISVSSRDDRWGIPANWVVNDAVKNYRNPAGEYFGGVDFWFEGPFLAMEAGWSGDNMTTITNGKIYQTASLTPGFYIFEMDIPDCTLDGDFYTVIAEGDGIPNTDNVTSTIAYRKTNSPGTHKISFTIEQTKTVSLGFVGNVQNKGTGDGTFWRINAVRLRKSAFMD